MDRSSIVGTQRRPLRTVAWASAAILALGGSASPSLATPELEEGARGKPTAAPEPPRPGSARPSREIQAEPESPAPVGQGPEARPTPVQATDPAPRRGEGIEEMTITARKREENLQDSPVSVTAFSESDLVEADVRRVDDIGEITPNLKFDQAAGNANSARLQIRGVTTNDFIENRDPGVGVYLDGIYLARSQGTLLGLADIERIEVLRGPQGTLFGRNTIGGAVNVISKKPSNEAGAEGSLRIGNFNLFESRASLNIPLVPEKAALRFSFQSVTRDGFTNNRLNGQETDDRRSLGGRVSLLVNPTDDVELLFTADQSRAHSAGRGGECRAAPALVSTSVIASLESLNRPANANGLDFIGGCQESEQGEELDYFSPVRSKDNLDSWGLSHTLTWDIGEVTFKSFSSWRRQENDRNLDFSFARVNVGNVIREPDEQDQVSQEFNLSGTALGGSLAWTGGLFGFYEKTTPGLENNRVAFNLCEIAPTNLQLNRLARKTALDVLRRMGQPVPNLPDVALDAPVPGLEPILQGVISQGVCDSSFMQNQRIRTNALAAYGQFTYDVTESFHFTAGLRRSLERKRYQQEQQRFARPPLVPGQPLPNPALPPMAINPFASDQSERFNKWTPLVNFSVDLAEDAMVYATYSRGFKSGGFNGRVTPGLQSTLEPFEQEVLDNFEVGLKSSWLDNRLVANLSLFHGNYQDIQQTILTQNPSTGGFASRVANAADAVIQGGELELRAVPTAGLDLRIALGFTDAEYDEFLDFGPGPNGTQVTIDRTDQDFENVPDFTANISAAYTFYDLFQAGDLTARLNWFHSGPVNYAANSAFDTVKQGTHGLLSGRLALALADGKTEIALFGENLLNRRYINSGLGFEDGFAVSIGYYGAPRMYGIEIRRTF